MAYLILGMRVIDQNNKNEIIKLPAKLKITEVS